MPSDTENDSLERYWRERTLCSDEACIGVIGPDGRCKQCGKPYISGSGGKTTDDRQQAAPAHEDEAPQTGDGTARQVATDGPADEDDYWRKRILCSDEACIGVIGPDGRCKECGKPYKAQEPAGVESNRDHGPQKA